MVFSATLLFPEIVSPVTKQFHVTLANNLTPLSTADFRVEAVDGTYREVFKGFQVDAETAARCLQLRNDGGVFIMHVAKHCWSDDSNEWGASIINCALKAAE